MYKIEWRDSQTGEDKSLTVHTLRSVDIVVKSLEQTPGRFRNVRFTRKDRRRVREIVVVLS